MIIAHDLHFAYRGGAPLLEGLGLELSPGLHLALAPNGTGKSTLLKILAGVERPNRGKIEVDGRDLWRDEVEARRRICYLPETPDVSPYARLDEIVELVASLRGLDPEVGLLQLERLGLGAKAGHSIRELSLGQRRRALLATVFMSPVSHYLLDEPLDSLDQRARELFSSWLVERLKGERVVLVSTHEIEPFRDLHPSILWRASSGWLHEPGQSWSQEELAARARGELGSEARG